MTKSAFCCEFARANVSRRSAKFRSELSRFYHTCLIFTAGASQRHAHLDTQLTESNWRKRVRVERTGDIGDAARRF